MWKIVQASVQGRGHLKNNIPCQDKTFSIIQNNVSVIVLADGAGSAALSHLGAEGVTKSIGNYMSNHFDDLFNQNDANVVRDYLVEEINRVLVSLTIDNQCKTDDLASTLLAVAVKDDSYIILHLGDGVIGYYNGESIKVASTPDNGEFANVTYFTTSKNVKKHIRLLKGKLKDICGFILFSDGPEPILYKHKSQEITPSFLNAFSDIQESDTTAESNLLDTLTTIRDHVVDDCSIIMMAKSVPNTESDIVVEPNNPGEEVPADFPPEPPESMDSTPASGISPDALMDNKPSDSEDNLNPPHKIDNRNDARLKAIICILLLVIVALSFVLILQMQNTV